MLLRNARRLGHWEYPFSQLVGICGSSWDVYLYCLSWYDARIELWNGRSAFGEICYSVTGDVNRCHHYVSYSFVRTQFTRFNRRWQLIHPYQVKKFYRCEWIRRIVKQQCRRIKEFRCGDRKQRPVLKEREKRNGVVWGWQICNLVWAKALCECCVNFYFKFTAFHFLFSFVN